MNRDARAVRVDALRRLPVEQGALGELHREPVGGVHLGGQHRFVRQPDLLLVRFPGELLRLEVVFARRPPLTLQEDGVPAEVGEAAVLAGGAVEVDDGRRWGFAHRMSSGVVFHGRPDASVFVGGDPQLEFRDIAHVIDICKGTGIRRVGLLPKDSR